MAQIASGLGMALIALAGSASTALAGPINLVTNGSFSSASSSVSTEVSSAYNDANAVTGWNSAGFNLWFVGANRDSVSALNHYNDPKTYFYNSFANLSPDGGSFMALDGDTGIHGALSQLINNLVLGTDYTVTFNWAATQLINRTGATTEQLQVSLGNQSRSTQVLNNPSGGFTGCATASGWCVQSFTFRATSASELLSFLSIGTPNGQPPIAVLDGVSMVAAPEPASWAVMLLGLGGLGAAVRSRRRGA
jgi:hypothetical protein